MNTTYPVYIVSKGRADNNLTAKFFNEDGLDYKLVVEPQEKDQYITKWGRDKVLILPFSNLGLGSYPARNWLSEHSINNGYRRHWCFDDNIRQMRMWRDRKRLRVNAVKAINTIEDWTDRYTNIGISGFNYTMFAHKNGQPARSAYYLNCHVYSAMLINNEMPFKWRLKYNEDVDLCLQVLSNKLCTVNMNVFMVDKMRTMTVKGGNTDSIYDNDKKIVMKTRMLQEMWPEYVKLVYRFKRPHHSINWLQFKQPLIRRRDIDWDNIQPKHQFNLVKA